ncbi:MAG: hypothetical protein ABIY46_03165, partial [Gemmatimonadales bacterium]
ALALFPGAAACGDPSAPDPAGGGPASPAAATVTNISLFQLDFVDLMPCTGEVHWTGTLRLVDHLSVNRGVPLDPDAVQHHVISESTNLSGIGLTSGGAYRMLSSLTGSTQSESPVNTFPTTFTIILHQRLFVPGGGLPEMLTVRVKLLLNGAGQLVLDEFRFGDTCG